MTTAVAEEVIGRAFSQPPELGQTLAIVAVHRGEVVAEQYGPDTGPDTTLTSWSMAKSITHALIGLLVRDFRLDVSAPAAVPRWQGADDPRAAITLEQLLHMRSGLHFVEDYVHADAHVSNVIDMIYGSGADDVAAYAESCALAHDPGAVWSYSSGTTNIVSALAGRVLAEAGGGGGEAGMRAYLEHELFAPIGMTSAIPRFDAAGTFIGSSFVYATARDFARFGELYLHDGVWNGTRVLPEGWVDHARTVTSPPAPPEEIHGYGAHWWIWDDDLGTFGAQGYEGQYTLVVPSLDLVVVRLGKTPADLRPAVTADLHRLIESFA
ncbi:MAG: serine hydrolase domain-containing protein [Acidimicrobiia bacterium]